MENLVIPDHIAIILDGNGRWAKAHMLPRKLGHKAGCEALENILEDCAEIGVKYLTVYAFSTENWKRSQEEVGALMQLFRYYLEKLRKRAMANNIRILSIGDSSQFAEDLQIKLKQLVDDTKDNTGLTFLMALNYGSRDEIVRGMRRLAQDAAEGRLNPEDISEAMISDYLDTKGIPDPDLLIRTSGEQRLSNFLLWQCAYSEMYFPEVLWPDFGKEELMDAIRVYNKRDRRFGGRKETEE